MFFKFKNFLTILVSTIGFLSFNASAAHFFPEESEDGIWQIGLEGTYLWQSDNTAELDSLTPTQQENAYAIPLINKTLEPNWGGGINVGYIFPDYHYDIQLSYNFLRLSDTEHGTIPVILSGTFPTPIPANTVLDYRFDNADILLGTYFSPTKRWLLRLGYGLEYVRIDQSGTSVLDNRGSDVGFPHLTHVNDTYSKNSFSGLGPKITLDGDFHLLRDIYVVGDIGLSVLYGKSEYELWFTGLIINDGPVTPMQKFTENNYQAAFGFEGSIGLAYIAEYSEDLALSLEAGFQGQSYINALQDETVEVDLAQVGDNSSIDFDSDYSNFGPYVNITLNFM